MLIRNNLDYILACLVSHSKWIRIIKEDIKKITPYFILSSKDKRFLTLFLNKNSQKLLVSSFLSEEKRWREMILFLKQSVQSVELKKYWHLYLDSFELNDSIPATPILEAIHFLNFLLNHHLEKKYTSIFKYEILKNQTLLYEFDLNDEIEEFHMDMLSLSSGSYRIQLNPSFIYQSFEVILPFAFSRIIGFYKQVSTQRVVTFSIKNIKTLLSLPHYPTIKACLNLLQADSIQNYIKKLSKAELIFFHRIK